MARTERLADILDLTKPLNMPESDLPSYEHPPVAEVTLGIQFAPIIGLQAAHLGLFWQQIRDAFPLTETHAPLGRVEEHFGPLVVPGFRIELVQSAAIPRAWFVSDSRNELIQVQPDRFVFNWRKVKNQDKYPRFPHVRERFQWALSEFQSFLAGEALGDIRIDQCEIAYTNSVSSGPSWSAHTADPGGILAVWNLAQGGAGIPRLESARVGLQFLIPGENEVNPVGRVYVDFQPVIRVSDDSPMFALNLVGRGRPVGEGVDGAMAFFERGRDCIVRAFTSLTTERMHKEWGRNDQSR